MCFEDYGIAKTTMNDVAKRAGVCRSISATQRDRVMRELFASDSFASTRAAVRLATPYFDAMVRTWTRSSNMPSIAAS